ncbi:MAG: ABC transporter ATP-binding protein [Microthrixaceae bacterium]
MSRRANDTRQRADVAVKAERVTMRYGSTIAVADVSFEVPWGGLVALTGPSGSGKSTLLQLIAGLERPTVGSLEVNGHHLDGHPLGLNHHRRSVVGLVFQAHNLIPRLTARQNVELAMFGTHRGRHDRSRRSAELLSSLGLGDHLRRYPPEMSGGERQRVAIARALANDPAVLLADEPTSGLDDLAATTVVDLLAERAAEGKAVIAASHDARLLGRSEITIALADASSAGVREPDEPDGSGEDATESQG